jgi:hypothetical protein
MAAMRPPLADSRTQPIKLPHCMVSHRLRHVALLAALVALAACASASPSASHNAGMSSGSKITPPQQLRAGPMPEIREEIDVRIDVLIDEQGQPDMRSLKVTGKGSGSSHAAIEDWVRNSTYRPAMQDGHPVAAVLHAGLKTSIQVRRM